MKNNQQGQVLYTSEEFAHALKYGNTEKLKEIRSFSVKAEYSNSFPVFMDRMLEEYGIKRKQIADRTGLSTDYLYKLLRGDKKTSERDYILAICIAVGMTLSQTQHALEISSIVKLDERDLRDAVVIQGVKESKSIHQINEWLEKANYPYIKVSPDMPSYNPRPIGMANLEKIVLENCEEVERIIEAEHCGNAPIDFSYWGILGIETEDGDIYYIEASYGPFGANFIVLDKHNYELSQTWCAENEKKQQDFFIKHPEVNDEYIYTANENDKLVKEYYAIINEKSPVEVLERYDSLGSAASSRFFEAFLELDKATDKKAIEVMKELDDTRLTPNGIRIGMSIGKTYLESFNTSEPERNEYFQIIQQDDGTMQYSVSHRSYYMQIEMGDFYTLYFQNNQEQEYFIKTDSLENLDSKYQVYYNIFKKLEWTLHSFLMGYCENDSDLQSLMLGDKLSKAQVDDEEIHILVTNAYSCLACENYELAEDCLERALYMMDTQDDNESGYCYANLRAVALYNLAQAYSMTDKNELFDTVNERLHSLKEQVMAVKDETEADFEALGAVASATFYLAGIEQNPEKKKNYCYEIIEMLEDNCTNQMEIKTLFLAYEMLSALIDSYDPEGACVLYRKAINIIRKNHFDQDYDMIHAVYVIYNNYAWVLWNMLGQEEAIIYYGRAIELMETYIDDNRMIKESMAENLKHVGTALYKLYQDTGKRSEAARLLAELKEYDIELEEK